MMLIMPLAPFLWVLKGNLDLAFKRGLMKGLALTPLLATLVGLPWACYEGHVFHSN